MVSTAMAIVTLRLISVKETPDGRPRPAVTVVPPAKPGQGLGKAGAGCRFHTDAAGRREPSSGRRGSWAKPGRRRR